MTQANLGRKLRVLSLLSTIESTTGAGLDVTVDAYLDLHECPAKQTMRESALRDIATIRGALAELEGMLNEPTGEE